MEIEPVDPSIPPPEKPAEQPLPPPEKTPPEAEVIEDDELGENVDLLS